MRYTYEHMEDLDGVVSPDFMRYDKNLILYGAGINGILCAFALRELGVEFLCFCDSDPLKQGSLYFGYPVYSPEECGQRYPNAAVLFDVYCAGKTLTRLAQLGYRTILYPAMLFLNLDCEKAAAFVSEKLGRGDDGYAFRDTVDALQVYEWIDEYMIRGVGYVNHNKEMSRTINLDLTDRCTLRCKNCLALKAYFKDPVDMAWEEMERVIDRLASLKWFRRFHLLGGEPFLYPHLDKVLEKLGSIKEFEHISIITNGTVIPSEAVLRQLRNPKMMVRVSYYGNLSKNYGKLEDICRQYNIEVRVHAQRWKDIGRALETASGDGETRAKYGECSQRVGTFFYVLHGKVTLCPFAANTYALGMYETEGGDIVDLLSDASPEELSALLNALYWREEPLTACRYCNGWLPYATKPVPVAEQCMPNETPVLPSYKNIVLSTNGPE